MKSVNIKYLIKYLYFDDQVCGRCKEGQRASHCDDCSCLAHEDVSCRSYGDTGQLSKNLILAALEKIL